MTSPVAAVPVRIRTNSTGLAGLGALAALGCGLLAARPPLLAATRHPAAALGALFAVLLVLGAYVRITPYPAATPRRTRVVVVTALLGVLAFAVGRCLLGGHAPTPLTVSAIAANTLAACAEEAWFRRLCYGLLEPAGPAFAVAASSLLFAAVHVSTYGVAVLPLDLAAGALLGWQRAATGSWAAPAVTHAFANLFVLL